MMALVIALATNAAAHAAVEHPCEQIKKACEDAKFVKGEYKEGKGLWRDCIEVVMGERPAPKNLALPLPTIDPQVIADCKAKHGTFGEGAHKK